jgi:hypothetical protein
MWGSTKLQCSSIVNVEGGETFKNLRKQLQPLSLELVKACCVYAVGKVL